MAKGTKTKKEKKSDKKGAKAASGLSAMAKNPLVADVVAAALVATAAALKDSKRAQALASDAGEELAKLSKRGAKGGEALWEMARQIGRRSLEALTSNSAKPEKIKAKTPSPKKAAVMRKAEPKKSGGKKRARTAAGR